jgi:hypothetical protein
MAAQVDICNLALVKLGQPRILSIADTSKQAQALLAVWDTLRDAELRKRRWSFSVKRANLTADVAVPVHGYGLAYSLPADCLRVLTISNYDIGPDMSDYSGRSYGPYAIEGRKIVTDASVLEVSGTLNLRYIARVEDSEQWDAGFCEAFANKIAMEVCETVTGSTSKQQMLQQGYMMAVAEAKRANAIEQPPQRINDDTWVYARIL